MIRGEDDQTQVTKVEINISLLTIQRLDEVEEWMEVAAVLNISWTDQRLTWNPNNYNGTQQVVMSQNEVWRPEIILSNPATSVKLLGDDRLFTRHYHNGVAVWTASDVFRARCSIDVTSYPWDRQICSLIFVPWGYFPSEVILFSNSISVDTKYFQKSDVWDLVSSYVVQNNSELLTSYLEFYVVLDRRTLFFITTIILPTLSLCLLNVCVFLLPVDSGERTSFSITVLLSFAVFLTLIGDHLPKSSEKMASICYFLLFVLLLSSSVCLCSILSLRMYHTYDNVPPILVQKVIHWLKGGHTPYISTEKSRNIDNECAITNETSEEHNCVNTSQKKCMYDWKEVSRMFDKVCLVTMTVCLVLSIGVYSFHVVTGRKLT